jgi:hypothetical protein
MMHDQSFEEIRVAARQKLETCELWLRRLIHEVFLDSFGPSYFDEGKHNGNHLFRSEVRKHAIERMSAEASRYKRKIDTLTLDQIVDTLCKKDLYTEFFRPALSEAYPDGNAEARTFLGRLVGVRNALSHSNPISVHDAERAFCYCDDIILSLKSYYEEQNMAQEYNAPRFTRFSDSLGNTEHLLDTQKALSFRDGPSLHSGDIIRLEVEVDASFQPDDYSISWAVANIPGGEVGAGHSFVLTLQPRHVGESFTIQAQVISNESWHRHQNFDADLVVSYKVLPPPT